MVILEMLKASWLSRWMTWNRDICDIASFDFELEPYYSRPPFCYLNVTPIFSKRGGGDSKRGGGYSRDHELFPVLHVGGQEQENDKRTNQSVLMSTAHKLGIRPSVFLQILI